MNPPYPLYNDNMVTSNDTSDSGKQQAAPGKLIFIRHGESEWNATGQWTGLTDVDLSQKGFREAKMLGEAVKDIRFDYAFTSELKRAIQTLEGVLKGSGQPGVPYEKNAAINERDYGDYTGMNKWEVRDKVGEDKFNSIRRDWDCAVPGGETLKMVYERALPYYQNTILPHVLQGEIVLVVAHGNSMRALRKHLENLSDEQMSTTEMPFGTIMIYEVDTEGRMTSKAERKIDTTPPPA
jgi:2,3-bisphosphoglycerate-dependent phosphoglycerate mutase